MTTNPDHKPTNYTTIHTHPQLVPPMRAGDGTMWRVLEAGPIELRADGRVKQVPCVLAPIPGADAQNAVTDLIEALRLTVEYVGTTMLPPIEGWSWYDALRKYHPELAQHFVEYHNRVVAPTLPKPRDKPRLMNAEDYLRATARAVGVDPDHAVEYANLRASDRAPVPEPAPRDPPDRSGLRFELGALFPRVVDHRGVEHCPKCDAPEGPRGDRRNYAQRKYADCNHRWHRKIGWRWRWGRGGRAPGLNGLDGHDDYPYDEPLDDSIRNNGG